MALTYAQYVTTIANELVVSEAEPNFVQILPSIINYAEERIYRELNLLATVVRDVSANWSGNSRFFTLPTPSAGRYVQLMEISSVDAGSARHPLIVASRAFIDAVSPNQNILTTPQYPIWYAMVTDQTIMIGPVPSSSFQVEIYGTIRPTPLSVTNTSTYLSLYLPDLLVAASMIFGVGWQRNFGAMANDPQMSLAWEGLYQKAFASADSEETRKRFGLSVNNQPMGEVT